MPFQQNIASQVISVRANNTRQQNINKLDRIIAEIDKTMAIKKVDCNKRIKEIGILEIDLLLSQLERDMNRQ